MALLRIVTVYEGIDYVAVRSLEQALMFYYHTINKNNPANNQINGISPYNKQMVDFNNFIKNSPAYLWNQISNDWLNFIGQ